MDNIKLRRTYVMSIFLLQMLAVLKLAEYLTK